MWRPYTIDIELFQYFKVFPNGRFVHGVPQIGMLHVRVYTVQFDGFSVQIKNLMANFGLFKTYPTCNYLFGFSFAVD